MRRRKKRKQVEDGQLLASDHFLLKTLWEPGVVDCRESLSLYSIGQGRFGCLVLWLFWGFVLVCFVFSVPDLSFWPRCPTMTILAQLNDCHSCNDARSIVQKKIDDLVLCALGSAGDSEIRQKRAGPPPGISTMVWWTDPGQVSEAIPRRAGQSHSSLPKTPISQEPYSAVYSLLPYGLIGFPCRFKALWIECRTYDKAWSEGSFRQKHLRRGLVTSESVSKSLDTWYEAVSTLPIAWPDITDIDPHYFKKTSAHILLAIRTQMGVSHMWGEILPQWHLLRHNLWNLGPGYHAGRLEELLILNRPLPARGRCQGFSLTPFILAAMVELGNY